LANSLLQFLENSFRRTGSVANKFATETIVPLCHQYPPLPYLGGDLCGGDFLRDDVAVVVVLEFCCARGIVASRCCDGDVRQSTQRTYRFASESKRVQLVQVLKSRDFGGVMLQACTSAMPQVRDVPIPSKSSDDIPEPSSVTSRRSTP
jgi:hypothetical protein